MKLLTLLMTTTDQIETAVKEKVDKEALDDISKRITSVEDMSRKLLNSNQDLQKELDKSLQGIRHNNEKLETFHSKID